jgi:DNA polymerase III subunit epsilon
MLSIDLETTGKDPQHDRITQIAIVPVYPQSLAPWQSIVNPEKDIPADVQALTGITNEMVKLAPPFRFLAGTVAHRLRGQTIVGFNCYRFDVPLLAEEFERAQVPFDWNSVTIIDVGELYKILQPRTLSDAVRHYLTREHAGAHDAEADAAATAEVFHAMKAQHSAIENKTPVEIAAISRYGKRMADPFGKLAYDEKGTLVFNTFRNKGVPVADDIGYAQWMLRSGFPLSTIRVLHAELDRLAESQGKFMHDDLAELEPHPEQQEIPF